MTSPDRDKLARDLLAAECARSGASLYAAKVRDGSTHKVPAEFALRAILTALTHPREEIGEDTAALRSALQAFLTWAQQQCPCHDDNPNPCPLCGASVENLESCKAIEAKFPRDILAKARAALASPSSPPEDANALDEQAEELFGLVYAHVAIKYDPAAAKRCIRRALASSLNRVSIADETRRFRAFKLAGDRDPQTGRGMWALDVSENGGPERPFARCMGEADARLIADLNSQRDDGE